MEACAGGCRQATEMESIIHKVKCHKKAIICFLAIFLIYKVFRCFHPRMSLLCWVQRRVWMGIEYCYAKTLPIRFIIGHRPPTNGIALSLAWLIQYQPAVSQEIIPRGRKVPYTTFHGSRCPLRTLIPAVIGFAGDMATCSRFGKVHRDIIQQLKPIICRPLSSHSWAKAFLSLGLFHTSQYRTAVG